MTNKEKGDTPNLPESVVRELLPCPFCGRLNSNGDPYVLEIYPCDGDYQVRCGHCVAFGPMRSSEHAAITGWSTRATPKSDLPELPEYAASLHVQHFRNAPSMRNTDFVESPDFPEGTHRLYTADQMRAYAAESVRAANARAEGLGADADLGAIGDAADRLTMFAEQMRDFARKDSAAPNTWHLDDAVSACKSALQSHREEPEDDRTSVDAAWKLLAKSGRSAEAAFNYRSKHGCSLREAKDAVDSWLSTSPAAQAVRSEASEGDKS